MEKKIETIGKPLDDYIRSRHTQEECIGFIDGWHARKDSEPILYTEEEAKSLALFAAEHAQDYHMKFPFEWFEEWFEIYKKK